MFLGTILKKIIANTKLTTELQKKIQPKSFPRTTTTTKKTRKIVHCQSCIADTLIYKMNHRAESIMKNKKKSNKEWERVKGIHFLEQTPWL